MRFYTVEKLMNSRFRCLESKIFVFQSIDTFLFPTQMTNSVGLLSIQEMAVVRLRTNTLEYFLRFWKEVEI